MASPRYVHAGAFSVQAPTGMISDTNRIEPVALPCAFVRVSVTVGSCKTLLGNTYTAFFVSAAFLHECASVHVNYPYA